MDASPSRGGGESAGLRALARRRSAAMPVGGAGAKDRTIFAAVQTREDNQQFLSPSLPGRSTEPGPLGNHRLDRPM